MKLAAISVPMFSGEYREWAAFQDIFMTLVHENQNLQQVEKFFLLRSAISGDAFKCIKYLETTSTNYDIACTALGARYNNKKELVQAHVKSIIDLDMIISKSSAKLQMH